MNSYFECALADALEHCIGNRASLVQDESYEITQNALVTMTENERNDYSMAAANASFWTPHESLMAENERNDYSMVARATIIHIMNLEPMISSGSVIEIQPDYRGKDGDVRDVINARTDDSWEIGFSAKNNHKALKHSRLSPNIDFGKVGRG